MDHDRYQSQWGYYLDKCPMSNYVCPVYCEVKHIHYKEKGDCSFMEYLIKSDTTIVTYTYQDEEITIEWISSW